MDPFDLINSRKESLLFVPSGIDQKITVENIPDCIRSDILFMNCPGTPPWPGVLPVMVFVASPVLVGTFTHEHFIQILLLALHHNNTRW